MLLLVKALRLTVGPKPAISLTALAALGRGALEIVGTARSKAAIAAAAAVAAAAVTAAASAVAPPATVALGAAAALAAAVALGAALEAPVASTVSPCSLKVPM